MRWREVYPADKHGGIICPLCGNGSGSSGTGISEWKDGYLSCFKCGFRGDVIDLIQAEKSVDFVTALEILKSRLGETSVDTVSPVKVGSGEFIGTPAEAYCKSRGLSVETCLKFGLYFAPSWKHPKTPDAAPSHRVIIPTSAESYLARSVDDDGEFSKQKVGGVHFFNFAALNQSEPVFVVEGEFDALSIEEVGGHAVSLGGVSNVKKFVEEVAKLKTVPPLILSLDNDTAGITAVNALRSDLTALGIPNYTADVVDGLKDASDALRADKAKFSERINRFMENPNFEEAEKIMQTSDFFTTDSMIGMIRGRRDVYSTGFDNLDRLLDGGLYPGLYIIGAVSSLGKTTFCIQMMDNIAKQGHDVIFFSLEMAAEELIAKAISRFTMRLSLKNLKNTKYAVTTREILKGDLLSEVNGEEKMKLVEQAFALRNEYSKHVFTKVGNGNIGVKEIREIVARHVEVMRTRPVVFVDYLQMLALTEHLSDKQNVDKAVLELKRISRDFNIPVIGISSFNRENYTTSVNLTSFKESGAIEYSSDVLIGLQYDFMMPQISETKTTRAERIEREQQSNFEKSAQGKPVIIELRVLKNRNGAKGSTFFQFWERYNCFDKK